MLINGDDELVVGSVCEDVSDYSRRHSRAAFLSRSKLLPFRHRRLDAVVVKPISFNASVVS